MSPTETDSPASGTDPASRASRADLLGGVVTALVGVIGYFPAPIAASEYVTRLDVSALDVVFEIFEYFLARSLAYHATILLLAPFVTTVAAVAAARRSGLIDREAEARIVVAVVVGPAVAVWIAMVVGLLAIAVFDTPAFAALGLPFALGIATFVSVVVATAEAVGALSGYALVAGFESIRERSA